MHFANILENIPIKTQEAQVDSLPQIAANAYPQIQ